VEEQRNRLDDHLADNPSLKAALDEAIIVACRNAILGASRETGRERGVFDDACPWTPADILDRYFWPDEA
jgi:hypothetical protein